MKRSSRFSGFESSPNIFKAYSFGNPENPCLGKIYFSPYILLKIFFKSFFFSFISLIFFLVDPYKKFATALEAAASGDAGGGDAGGDEGGGLGDLGLGGDEGGDEGGGLGDLDLGGDTGGGDGTMLFRGVGV